MNKDEMEVMRLVCVEEGCENFTGIAVSGRHGRLAYRCQYHVERDAPAPAVTACHHEAEGPEAEDPDAEVPQWISIFFWCMFVNSFYSLALFSFGISQRADPIGRCRILPVGLINWDDYVTVMPAIEMVFCATVFGYRLVPMARAWGVAGLLTISAVTLAFELVSFYQELCDYQKLIVNAVLWLPLFASAAIMISFLVERCARNRH
jgi:hypothetical protein